VDSNSGGIYRSTFCDPSQFWVNSKSYANIKLSSVAVGDNNKCITCDKNGKLYLGSNYGTNWSVITDSNLPTIGLWKNVSSSRDGTIMFALETDGYVYYSVTSGETWQKTNLGKGQWSYSAISDNINNMYTVAIVDYRGYIQIGSLSGSNVTFKIATVDKRPWTGIAISNSGLSIVAVASNGFAIVTSTDRGETWKITCAPYTTWQGVVSDSTGTKILAIQYGGGIWYSNNGGASWKQTSAPNHKWVSICGSEDLCKIIAAAENCSIYMSFDFGATWLNSNSRISNWTGVACTSSGINAIAVDINGDVVTTASIQTCLNPNYIAGTYMSASPAPAAVPVPVPVPAP
jgi:phage pi2 protein 07